MKKSGTPVQPEADAKNQVAEKKTSAPDQIVIRGARTHNLRNVSVAIPHGKLTVITGVSGSGKSSLAFHTLYAEGHRRYVESLSSYARQFLGRMERPDVDDITGLSPAVAIEQKVVASNARSTVGTTTEIYDYLKLLFARIGHTFSPVSGGEVRRHDAEDVVRHVLSLQPGTRCLLAVAFPRRRERPLARDVELLLAQGFSRLFDGEKMTRLQDWPTDAEPEILPWLVIDRFAASHQDDEVSRITDSAETAFYEGGGACVLFTEQEGRWVRSMEFSNRFEADGIAFEPPSVNLFSFNNPYGACRTCEGYGWVLGIDENLVIPDPSRSVYDDAVVCWKGETLSWWKQQFIRHAVRLGFPIHKPYEELTDEQKAMLWKGRDGQPYGIDDFFRDVESQLYKIQYRVLLSRYRGRTECPDCRGTCLRKDASYVKVGGKSITDLVLLPVGELLQFFDSLSLPQHEALLVRHVLGEIRNRLQFLCDVGLSYLTLNRRSRTLSGGETQRIQLATSLGSTLTGATYILDEPSIGLHPRDTHRLLKTLMRLRDEGNTVVVVEHDRDIIEAADYLVDIGPMAGWKGGEVVYEGPAHGIVEADSLTALYLTGKKKIPVPSARRQWKEAIVLEGARGNNLKNIDFVVPLGVLSGVSGVSGSGKTTLVKKILYPALARKLGESVVTEAPLPFHSLELPYSGGVQGGVQGVELVDQSPIGLSSRSNAITYLKIFDDIRQLFADQPLSRRMGFKASHFSFNVPGGRCEECEGEGYLTIEMQFMADVKLLCEACGGRRFKEEVLEVKYRDKSVDEVLQMTVDEAVQFFSEAPEPAARRISSLFQPLQAVGLDYLKLGQSASTLSGGEAQRVKLAYFLSRSASNTDKKLFIFDEPTTGLHFHDIGKLMQAFEALLEKGHSVLVIEHNLDVLKCCDYITDLGPEGGPEGGHLVAAGTPEEIARCSHSHTGTFLKNVL